MVSTPASGIVRANPDYQPTHCHECAAPLVSASNYPDPGIRLFCRDAKCCNSPYFGAKPPVITSTIHNWTKG